METTKLINLQSMDICKFVIPHNIGHIIEMKAKITYVDPKKGLAYLQVQSRDKDPQTFTTSSFSTQDTLVVEKDRNLINLIYRVDKSIQLKQILPTNYAESLLYLHGKRIIDAI